MAFAPGTLPPISSGPSTPRNTFGGFYNFDFNPDPQTFANEFALGDFGSAFDAFLQPYGQAFTGTNFYDFLRGPGRRLFEDQFNSTVSGQIAQGVNPSQLTTAMDFLRGVDPTGLFGSYSPRDRGENTAYQNMFTRYLR